MKLSSSKKIYSRIATFFIILTIGALALILHITLATATIHVKPTFEQFTFDGPIETDLSLSSSTPAIELEGQSEFTVGGKKVTTDKAGVEVTIFNTTGKAQALVKTTRFLTTDQKLFRLQNAVSVPAKGSVKAFIEADEAGDSYLVPAGKFTIPGLASSLQSQIYGQSETAASFERTESLTVTDEDISKAEAELREKMMPSALAELKKVASIEKKENILAKTLEKSTDVAVGAQAQKFLLKAKMRFYYLDLSENSLRERTLEALKRKLPDGMTVNTVNDDSFSYQINDQAEPITVTAHMEAQVSKNNDLSSKINRSSIYGRSAAEAKSILTEAGYPVEDVTLWPFWVRSVPRLDDHIIISNN